MNRQEPAAMDDEVAEQAAHWFLCNREGDLSAAQRIEFMAWMKRSPEHIRAYLHVLHVHRQVGAVMVAYGQEQGDRAAQPELPATAKVVPLFAVPVPVPRAVVASRSRRPLWRRVAAVACCLLLVAGLVPWLMPREQMLIAGHGQLREVVLADRTQVRLNADSRLRVNIGWFSRRVELLSGEATFDIAADHRPFEVQVGDLRIRDIGTVFDVSRRLQSTRIGVVSGEVEVWTAGSGQRRLAQLPAGKVVQVDHRSHAVQPLEIPMSMLLDWQQRRVSFRDERLDEVAAAFNRHNQVQVRLTDDAARAARLSGSLEAHRVAALQAFLQRDARFVIRREADTVWVSSR
ncbi:FecR family protein [Stenotrophomonas indicatrix]|uniref:FecR family protein n=1 Tax=Stenotrophomonas indicatrix TaxID=2045451 RepID=UPI000C256550|nr:FecR domain-containing protein [Stenotrophomonas indicatrix]PJL12412.1 iron dicitrate transport regulator FecR [Stenotrophomonas maltophilia]PJL21438.1 iron dicitrate transport regulator FecR [Stenotrophomonas maltophilia]